MRILIIASALLFGLIGCDKKAPQVKNAPSSTSTKKPTVGLRLATNKPRISMKDAHFQAASKYVTPPQKAPAQDPKKLVATCVAKKGGLDKLKTIKTMKSTSVMRGMVNASTNFVQRLPDHYRADVFKGKKYLRSVVQRGKKAFIVHNGKVVEMKGKQLMHSRRATAGDSMSVLMAASKADAKLTYLGSSSVMGKPAHALKITMPEGFDITFFLDVANHDLVATQFFTGMYFMTIVESNFKVVAGVRFAHTSRLLLGVMPLTATVLSLELNPKIDPSTFTKLTK